jgi:hypothetical protein
MNKQVAKPVEIRFNVYANATGPKLEVLHAYRLPVTNMTREDCISFREELYRNPHVGTCTIYLDNGCHI